MINKFSSEDYLRNLAERMKSQLEGKTEIDEWKLSEYSSDSVDPGGNYFISFIGEYKEV